MASTDEELYMDDDAFVQKYFHQPSPHRVDSSSSDGDDHEIADLEGEGEGGLPILNADGVQDHEGAPYGDTYQEIPLPEQFRDIISIQIKKTGFVRQKVHEL
jgi:hypothetical protein